MTILVKVTKEIIKLSAKCDSNFSPRMEYDLYKDITKTCAVSRAIVDLLPDAFVFQMSIRFFHTFDDYRKSLHYVYISLPNKVHTWIKEFDSLTPSARLMMDPIEFEIDIPSNLIDKIGISEVYKVLSESPTLELVSI